MAARHCVRWGGNQCIVRSRRGRTAVHPSHSMHASLCLQMSCTFSAHHGDPDMSGSPPMYRLRHFHKTNIRYHHNIKQLVVRCLDLPCTHVQSLLAARDPLQSFSNGQACHIAGKVSVITTCLSTDINFGQIGIATIPGHPAFVLEGLYSVTLLLASPHHERHVTTSGPSIFTLAYQQPDLTVTMPSYEDTVAAQLLAPLVCLSGLPIEPL